MDQDVNLVEKWEFTMLIVFSPIFVADTKKFFRYNFVAHLRLNLVEKDSIQQILWKILVLRLMKI